ncbi:hypothetical protein FXF61_10470 [Pseudomonas sp. C27(2019)]|uniref:hypothetical protein n=1 Tax=Pseudomonas sp. C27(2019) TaxID=2604941 RepID=UPI001246127D|nr:hypothetical protein [Pseudomonas sp. C27(2019)]QEY59552.1 hypothetical protein FXF61_10470 [Pseudomonas sp. C27(2019)]
MIWHLLAVFIIGLCVGALAFLLRKLSRNTLPSWIIPVCAGLGMLGYLAYYDYSWFEFKRSQLPAESVVVGQTRGSSFFRPWSYLIPSVSSFVVLDGTVRESQQDGETLVEYIRYEFINDSIERLESQAYVLNCTTGEQLAVMPSGSHATIKVEFVASDSLLYKQLCR